MKNGIIGVNHQFLFLNSATDAAEHTRTLAKAVELSGVEALDVWVWRGTHATEEIRLLKQCGKRLHYNIGDRYGETPIFPASEREADRRYALDVLKREISYALEIGARKVVVASGPDLPHDREGGKARLGETLAAVAADLPREVSLTLEPTDREIDKRFLFGPLSETVAFVRAWRREIPNLGILLDMSHIPLMGETLSSAVDKTADTLAHVHLGNCLLKDKSHPLYGDKHPSWCYPDSAYTEADGVEFLTLLKKQGYFKRKAPTVSFEMRPYEGLTAEESLARFLSVWETAKNKKENAPC